MSRSRSAFLGIGATALAVLFVLFALRAPLLRALVAGGLDVATGYRFSFESLDAGSAQAVIGGLHASRDGEPVLDARRVTLRYRLRDLLPGGARRFGLTGFELVDPTVTLVRRADGSFNVPVPAAGAAASASPASPASPPLAFTGVVRRGRIVLLDPGRLIPESRRLELTAIEGSAVVNTAGHSEYAVSGLLAGDPGQRIVVRGRFEADGDALHRFRARRLTLPALLNYVANAPSARFAAGTASAVDLRAYAFAPRSGQRAAYHLAGAAFVSGAALRVPGLAGEATGLRGRIDAFDGGLAAPRLDGALGGLPVRLAGGLFDWHAPVFRLGIASGAAPLAIVRRLFAFSRDLPLEGTARLTALLEGPVASPLVAVRVASPRLSYRAFPVAAAHGRALFYQSAVTVAGARGRYGGLSVTVNGNVDLVPAPYTQLVVGVSGPSSAVPFLAEAAPGVLLHGGGVLEGDGIRVRARGALGGSGNETRLAGTFDVDPLGDGVIGPLSLVRPDGGGFYGALYLDRFASQSGFWLVARDLSVLPVPGARLPGIALAPPVFAGRLEGELAGVGPPSAFRLAGRVRGRGLRIGTLVLDGAEGRVAGALGNLQLAGIAASGPWGRFTGDGAYAAARLALQGEYRGSFSELAALTGDLGGRGPVAGPVALLIDPARTLVQARGDRTAGSSVRGVPVDRVSGTLALAGRRLRVFSALGSVAGGTLAAAGTPEGGGLGVSLAEAQGARLLAVAPLGSGRFSAIGRVDVARGLAFSGGLAVGDAVYRRLPLSINGDVHLAGPQLALAHGDAVVGAGLGTLEGEVSGVGSGRPRYDIGLQLISAQVAPFARTFAGRRDVSGTVAGTGRLRGTPASLALAGTLSASEGSVNGLPFRDGSARLRLDRTGFSARRGRVTVGTTRARFGAALHGDVAAVGVNAPRADLADFNDYFDAGDTLGGRGSIAVRFVQRRGTARTNADVAVAGLRYRRFELGDAVARWQSHGKQVTGFVRFGGPSGQLETAGTLTLASGGSPRALLAASRFAGTARLRGLELGVWLPALGLAVPLAGRVDADATVAGPLRDPDVRTQATLQGGSIGSFPVNRLVLSATSTLSRTTVTRAELDLPFVTVTGSGHFGLRARDPVALALHAKSEDVGAIAARTLGSGFSVTGTAEMDVKVDGTRARPNVAGGFDLENASARGVAIPRALGEFGVRGRDLVLSDVEVGFATGVLYFAGSVPLQLAPLSLGPPGAPLTVDVRAKGVQLTDFAPLLPAGSILRGEVNGHVLLAGTAGSPRLAGTLALGGGAFQSPLETTPVENLSGRLVLADSDVRLEALHGEAGGGSLDADGAVTVARGGASYVLNARANRLRLNVPAYGSGQLDGALRLARRPGPALPRLSGKLALSEATIPFSALLSSSGGAAAPGATVGGDALLDLTVAAERNVRIRSANVDIGARGDVHLGGRRFAPVLAGTFTSTGGTLAYLNTVFRLTDGTVTFEPDLGLVPTLNVRATTHVINPDPNAVRNVAGTADIALDLTGPVTGLNIALTSDPPYDREQILGLLLDAPALGATGLFGDTARTPTLYGSTGATGAPPSLFARSSNGVLSVAQEAFGIANAQFTRTLLAPIETSFASAVGLSSFNVNVDYTGSVGVTARKILGKTVNALYGSSFGYPYRQSFGFEIKPNDSTAAQVTVFETLGASGLNSLAPTAYGTGTNQKLQAAQPTAGTVGFSLSLQRLYP